MQTIRIILLLVLPSANAIIPSFSFCPIDALPLIACNCTQTIFPPVLTSKCVAEGNSSVCDPLIQSICGTPSLSTKFDFVRILSLQFPLTVTACLDKVSLFGINLSFVNNLCFEFITPIFSFFTGFVGGLVSSNAVVQPSSSYSICNALVNGEECESCEVCDDGKGGVGVMFQCGEFQATTCTTVSTKSLPTSTKESSRVDAIVSSLAIEVTA